MSDRDAEFWRIVRANYTTGQLWALGVVIAQDKYRRAIAAGR